MRQALLRQAFPHLSCLALLVLPEAGFSLSDLAANKVLVKGFWAWFVAQFLKVRGGGEALSRGEGGGGGLCVALVHKVMGVWLRAEGGDLQGGEGVGWVGCRVCGASGGRGGRGCRVFNLS